MEDSRKYTSYCVYQKKRRKAVFGKKRGKNLENIPAVMLPKRVENNYFITFVINESIDLTLSEYGAILYNNKQYPESGGKPSY